MDALTAARSDSVNNVSEFPNVSEIKDEAAAWVLKLHGYTYKTEKNIPEDQVIAFRFWLAKSDFHRDCFLKTLGGWEAMGMLQVLADILPLADTSSYQQETANARKSGGVVRLAQLFIQRRIFLALTSTMTAACALMVWMFLFSTNQPTEYVTSIGELSSYSLNDGSVITLNTNSEVHVDFGDASREITLIRGEVNFDVTKDKARPFVVYAGKGMVRAVGTAFNVNYSGGFVDVFVSEGTVEVFSGVSAGNQTQGLTTSESASHSAGVKSNSGDIKRVDPPGEVLLDAGEAASYKDHIVSKQALAKPNIEKKLAWQVGALIFEGETLEEALQEIARYTDRKLIIVDASIRGTRVGGRFKTEDIDSLLDSLASGLNLKAERGEGNSILLSAK